MEENITPHSKRRGYYARQLATFQSKPPVFKRSKKKQIKKQNKQSCKQSRQRKNLYLSHLQLRNTNLQQQNTLLRQEIDRLKTYIELSKTQPRPEPDQRIKMLHTQFKQLVVALNRKNKQAITRSLAVLRDKFGISGRQRKKWMEENLLRAIELSMPLHFRVLTENVDDSYKFFDLLGGNDGMRTYRVNFGEKERNVLKEMKPRIKKAKQNFGRYHCKIYQKIHSGWTQLTKYSQQAQKIIDSIQDNLDPVFVGNLLVNLDSQRCSSQQIKQIYPINFFKAIPEEREIPNNYYHYQSSLFLESEDSYAFGVCFNQF